jgi:hypothetical protein
MGVHTTRGADLCGIPSTCRMRQVASGYATPVPLPPDPTPAQRRALARTFGCARVVYNDGLRLREAAYRARQPFIGDAELSRRVVTLAKQTPERAWLGEVSAVVLQQSVADLSRAYRSYFADLRRVNAADHGASRPS